MPTNKQANKLKIMNSQLKKDQKYRIPVLRGKA